MTLYYATPESLARSRKLALERLFKEEEPRYWAVKLAQVDPFWDQTPAERWAFYQSKQPIIPFFAALSDLGKMQGEQVAKMTDDFAALQKKYGVTGGTE